MTKRIIITGASGFIGSFLVEKALSENYEVWAGVRQSSNKDYLKDERINFIDLNYGNKEQLKAQLKDFITKRGRFDYVIHNAGITKCLNIDDFDKINFRFTVNLIDTLREAATPDKFILMSPIQTPHMEKAS